MHGRVYNKGQGDNKGRPHFINNMRVSFIFSISGFNTMKTICSLLLFMLVASGCDAQEGGYFGEFKVRSGGNLMVVILKSDLEPVYYAQVFGGNFYLIAVDRKLTAADGSNIRSTFDKLWLDIGLSPLRIMAYEISKGSGVRMMRDNAMLYSLDSIQEKTGKATDGSFASYQKISQTGDLPITKAGVEALFVEPAESKNTPPP